MGISSAERRVTVSRYPYRARALWGQSVVAESDSCLCVEEAGEAATLYFPPDGIRMEVFRPSGDRRPGPVRGKVQWLSIDHPRDSEGDNVLWRITEPADQVRQLAGYGAFDQNRVGVEIIDGNPGDDEQEITTKRFPTWGDAAHLIELLNVNQVGDLTFTSCARSDVRRPVVEGSQMLGQVIVAAGRLAPERRVVSASMIFMRSADAAQPLQFDLAELSGGRSFTTFSVQVLQGARCCATGTLLLDVTSPEVIHHAASPPEVPGPYVSPPYDMGVTGRDVRVVDGAYTNGSAAPLGPPVIDAWVRFRDVPRDPVLHAALLAQFTGHMSIAAALRPHEGIGQDQAHRNLSMGINSINLSLHREVRADRWMLYHHLSTFAGSGMTHSECRVHDEGGDLVASFTVDAMVRPFPDESMGAVDQRTAL